jgi:hypothetical protein
MIFPVNNLKIFSSLNNMEDMREQKKSIEKDKLMQKEGVNVC